MQWRNAVEKRLHVWFYLPLQIEWINAHFLLDQEIEMNEEERRLEFVSLRNQSALIIELSRGDSVFGGGGASAGAKSFSMANSKSPRESLRSETESLTEEDFLGVSSSAGDNKSEQQEQHQTGRRQSEKRDSTFGSSMATINTVAIYCDSMELAGACVQSLCGDFLAMGSLPCHRAHFPEDIARLKTLIDRVEDVQSVRQHLVAEVADSANLIRSAVVQAEDARLIEE